MSTPALISAALESALDLYLKQDPDALQRCAALRDKVIAINLTGTDFSLYLLPDAEGIKVLTHYEGKPDTLLRGTPAGFARLALETREDALFHGAVEIIGDTETGQAFQELLSRVDWDWEEQLSRLTGDTVAHQLGELVRKGQRWLTESGDTLQQDLSEYLQEEARLLPARVELSTFLDAVDQLRSDTDRLSARVERLLNLHEEAS
ncbi:ubiquinone biosynthesis protein UbiJ [Thiogranum longum]|uniref:Ubiquinone biosynthesis accessory factor UbiJ n=1 Tax=Thiogranum longum TaxID=1537524 RepID=A0A4R1HC95_9GAMM|nr:SCP2 sterol-binding domain-containing protein [Thiogranum longum]TCK16839.1 ubiquinone biosynthesis protein UbiJ [Thiogranum longum]